MNKLRVLLSPSLCVGMPSVPAVAATLHNIPSRKILGMKSLLPSCLLVAAFGLFATTQASASTFDLFTITSSPYTLTFTLPSSPTVATGLLTGTNCLTSGANGFCMYADVSINGGSSSQFMVEFDVPAGRYTMDFLAGGVPQKAPYVLFQSLHGYQGTPYTGPDLAPIFQPGTFYSDNVAGKTLNLINGSAGLTIAAIPDPPAPTPEPSSLMLLGTGILGLAGVLRRRFAV